MAQDKAFLKDIPTILEFDQETLESGQNVLISNFTYSRVDEKVKEAEAKGVNVEKEFNNEDFYPTESGLTNKAFLEIMYDCAQEYGYEVMIADGDTMIVKGGQGVLEQFEDEFGESGHVFDFSLGNEGKLKRFLKIELELVSKDMELEGAPYEHTLTETVPRLSL